MGDIEAAVKALKAGVDVLKVISLLFQYNIVFELLLLPVHVHLLDESKNYQNCKLLLLIMERDVERQMKRAPLNIWVL